MRREGKLQQPAKCFLRRAVRRHVVVRQVKMCDAQVKGAARNRTGSFEWAFAAEVVPQPERNQRQLEPRSSTAPVKRRMIVTGRRRLVRRHGWNVKWRVMSDK